VASFAIFILVAAVAFGAFLLMNMYQGEPVTNDTASNGASYSDPIATPVAIQVAQQSSMKQFTSEDDLNAFLTDHEGSSSLTMNDGLVEDMELSAPAAQSMGVGTASPTTKSSAPDSTKGYSSTNIQVEGVDECDVVKTDGTYIYTVTRNAIDIVKVNSDNSLSMSSTTSIDGNPQNLYVQGDRLVVYGTDTAYSTQPFYDLLPRQSSSFTFVKIFDISDRTSPKKVRDLEFEGNYVDSRMIGDYVYIITSNPFYALTAMPLPVMIEDGNMVTYDMAQGGVYYLDIPYENYAFTRVNAIPVTNDNQDVSSQIYLLNSTENMYVSQTAMYLTYTKYVSDTQIQLEAMQEVLGPKLSATLKQHIKDIEDAPPYVLSYYEKQSKIYQVYAQYIAGLSSSDQTKANNDIQAYVKKTYVDISKELEKTVIQKVAINGATMTLGSTGEVTGHVLNQFSMDEQGDYFRVATTKSSNWSRFADATTDSYNNLYVLDKNLKLVGKVENLAKGEQIYSTRFMQNRAYIVTFKQTDPLFVVDLTSPTNPKVLGELKVPGFSSYLHPYVDTTLIGFGKDADQDGRTKGIKISLFNVADPSNLQEVATYTIGDRGSDSIALYDYKAFLFSKEKNLLVIPMTVRESADGISYGSVTSNGAAVFTVTPTSIDYRATISHLDASEGSVKENNMFYGYSYYSTSVKRTLYIGDELFTVSDRFIKANDLGTLTEEASLPLAS